ncbi:MAG TPA: N-acetylmuramoyl-L-alanine amidase [Xanthobacteraceae bacterium]
MQKSFRPDASLVSAVAASPNFDARLGGTPDMILLHYTGMASAEAALARLCDPAAKVSSHYFVHEDGRVLQLVPETQRAWHAGEALWDGKSDINSCSIGIEIVNPGHDLGYPHFPRVQIEAVIALCHDIIKRSRIRADRILAHSDVAPLRKQDPGEKFPWEILHDKGVGHLVTPALLTQGPALKPGDRGEAVTMLQTMLARYGYGVPLTGEFDATTADVVTAFQRHFRRVRVDGIADTSTVTTLRDLLAARPI